MRVRSNDVPRFATSGGVRDDRIDDRIEAQRIDADTRDPNPVTRFQRFQETTILARAAASLAFGSPCDLVPERQRLAPATPNVTELG